MRGYLQNIGLFTDDEIDSFLSHAQKLTLAKGDYFIKEGEVAKRIGFVLSGLLRSFYYASNSDEVTYCFSFPNELVAGYSSIITQQPTNENIQALGTCELLVFPKSVLDEMVERSEKWLLFAKQVAEMQYVALEKRVFLLQKENAATRYKELLANHPEFIQNIPLRFLASYLGISQRHLSRLRKQMSF